MAQKPEKLETAAPSSDDSKVKSPFSRFLDAIKDNDIEEAKRAIALKIDQILEKHSLKGMNFLILHDENDSISNYHSNQIYSEANKFSDHDKDLILVLNSPGGRIEPAYLISKSLKKMTSGKFIVVVPRRAKSAATLISLGADEIHMGNMSELGPIDPQMQGLPALALGNALVVIAELVSKFPESARMFNEYIKDQVPIRLLGYYQRINESAVQYAERLLNGKTFSSGKSSQEIADHLVNQYKDHSFVIDGDEAISILGDLVKLESNYYRAVEEIFEFFALIDVFCDIYGKLYWIVGGKDGFNWREKKKEE